MDVYFILTLVLSCLDFTVFPVTQVFFMQRVSLFLALATRDPRLFRSNETNRNLSHLFCGTRPVPSKRGCSTSRQPLPPRWDPEYAA